MANFCMTFAFRPHSERREVSRDLTGMPETSQLQYCVIGRTLMPPAHPSSPLGSLAVALQSQVLGELLIPPPPLVTDQPYFDSSMKDNQTAHVGRQAELHCRVHSIGNRTVSWIRGRDLRILAVGRYTYTTDLRYEALHQAGTNQWTLRIKSVQPRDQGTYECQISTKPIKEFTTYLTVLKPRGEILGAPDLYVQKASMINLTCVLYDLPEPPSYVLWYHSNKYHSLRVFV
ncbi:cell adhesion molecule 2-like [Penaeus indicus]|uniref:cell adhesion molecule 2-like n=1 Tax=Penaeus indicus TaxID=29960 RepID=UPI00300C1E2C